MEASPSSPVTLIRPGTPDTGPGEAGLRDSRRGDHPREEPAEGRRSCGSAAQLSFGSSLPRVPRRSCTAESLSAELQANPRCPRAHVGHAALPAAPSRRPRGRSRPWTPGRLSDPPNMATSSGAPRRCSPRPATGRTGVVTLLDCLAAHDRGTVINPMLVLHGQLAGGLAQALRRRRPRGTRRSTKDGSLRMASFMDYLPSQRPWRSLAPPLLPPGDASADIPGRGSRAWRGWHASPACRSWAAPSTTPCTTWTWRGSISGDRRHDCSSKSAWPGPRKEGRHETPRSSNTCRSTHSQEAVALLSEAWNSQAKVLGRRPSLVPDADLLASPSRVGPSISTLRQRPGPRSHAQDDGHVVIGAMTRQRRWRPTGAP